jgi:hypothetical protein
MQTSGRKSAGSYKLNIQHRVNFIYTSELKASLGIVEHLGRRPGIHHLSHASEFTGVIGIVIGCQQELPVKV